jgi:hypothetical protein
MNIRPIIPIRRRDAFDDPAFLYELKYDGFRALADTVNGRILSKGRTPRAMHRSNGTRSFALGSCG